MWGGEGWTCDIWCLISSPNRSVIATIIHIYLPPPRTQQHPPMWVVTGAWRHNALHSRCHSTSHSILYTVFTSLAPTAVTSPLTHLTNTLPTTHRPASYCRFILSRSFDENISSHRAHPLCPNQQRSLDETLNTQCSANAPILTCSA